jgi:hypothetical protein
MSPNRFGEPDDEEPPADDGPAVDAHKCDSGFIDADADHPVPCLVCRPHLAHRVTRLGE